MGMGFAYIVPSLEIAESVVGSIAGRGRHRARIIGEVRAGRDEQVRTVLHKPYEGPALEFTGY
jgi:hypothetical protein